jgi:hypothetical protein
MREGERFQNIARPRLELAAASARDADEIDQTPRQEAVLGPPGPLTSLNVSQYSHQKMFMDG